METKKRSRRFRFAGIVIQAASFIAVLTIIVTLLGLLASFVFKAVEGGLDGLLYEGVGDLTALLSSTAALAIAFLTFYLIDNVNLIDSMDGNVLTDEHYSIAYYQDISRYADCKTSGDFADKVYEVITEKRHRAKNLVMLSDQLQTFIDNLIWIAYIKRENDYRATDRSTYDDGKEDRSAEVLGSLRDYLSELKDNAQRYKWLSSNVGYLIEENLMLIECVLAYQDRAVKASDDSKCYPDDTQAQKASIVDIRGEMLRNPISRIVYYDYLGLHYLDKASALIEAETHCPKQDLYNKKGVLHFSDIRNIDKERERLICLYLDLADKAFSAIESASESSLLWNGYISYNQSRVSYLRFLMEKNGFGIAFDNKIQAALLSRSIENTLKVREDILLIIRNDICEKNVATSPNGGNDLFIVRRFEREVGHAKHLREAFREVVGEEAE